MTAFVGYKENLLSQVKLLELISKLKPNNTYCFLRWNHKVSGIQKFTEKTITNDKFPMLEGQIFNHEFELRWKYKQNNNYEVLFLSINDASSEFQPLGGEWQTEERQAYFYPFTETRFPKDFDYPDNLHIKQRYFLDKTTATVHFIALTVEK
ncbi:hypothetical protein [Anabaena azotica]|uniref:hypothetical protein n=1 Tax=Anabaena azotica TaxID=197653 RepID=UPI0039A611F8